MSNLNPEVEAQKTVASFKEAAEKHTTIAKVWDEMAKDSKEFGHNSAKDKAYFHAVTEGLKKEGLLPEMTVAYAQWHKGEMPNDNGDVGKHRIDSWARWRKVENGRVCEVEQAFLDNLKSSYDSMKTLAQSKTRDYNSKGLSDRDLDALGTAYAKVRHDNEARAQQEEQVTATAQKMKHELLDPRKDNGSVLFDKLSRENGGRYITMESMQNAVTYDTQNRANQYQKGGKWQSFLNHEDHEAIFNLQSKFNDIAPVVGGGRSGQRHSDKISREDLDRYFAAHGGK